MHRCKECHGEFGHYRTPGQCPLCGAWTMIRCKVCGYHGAASFYLENDFKCPRCGHQTHLPGGPIGTGWVVAGLCTVALLVLGTIVFFVTR